MPVMSIIRTVNGVALTFGPAISRARKDRSLWAFEAPTWRRCIEWKIEGGR